MAALPASAGISWLVAQHLDPARHSQLASVLQHFTPLTVREASDGAPLRPDTVHVLPPGMEVALDNARLRLSRPAASPQGTPPVHGRHTADALFTRLAQAFGARAAGVVLSGTGDDGAAGVKALRAVGAVTAAQDPASATFADMPLAAIAAGARIVATAEDLPKQLLQALSTSRTNGPPPRTAEPPEASELSTAAGQAQAPRVHAPQSAPAATEAAPGMDDETPASLQGLAQVLLRLRRRHGYDLSLYKRSTLLRRIRRRMDIHRMSTLAAYARLLEDSPAELDLLAREILIGVTAFFRDRDVWQMLCQQALPTLLASCEDGAILRAWVAGCSTGEEAYSLAMGFREAVEAAPGPSRCTLQIFATDLNPDAIARARRGWYAGPLRGEVSAARLARFFTPYRGGWRVTSEIREMVVFAPHDVGHDPPFTRLDLISCRNLLIYLTAPLQRRLLPLFHYSLRPGGLLLLGSSEAIGRFDDLFEPIDARLRLYRRRAATVSASAVPDFTLRVPAPRESGAVHGQPTTMNNDPPAQTASVTPGESTASGAPAPDAPPANLQLAAEQALLRHWAPAAVLVNDRGDILYINGRTGRYLEPAAGKANWNVHVMARPGLRAALADALHRASTEGQAVDAGALALDDPRGPAEVHLHAHPLDTASGLPGMTLLVFRDLEPPAMRKRRRSSSRDLGQLEADLQRAREEAQSLREEMRASQEELQAANEELQSTNEELQSTNEELTSSKEAMQSMNEELQSVNTELQAKLDDLAEAHSDIRNLLNSTDVATLFLDRHLHVRRFTERARRIISLRDTDIGRPLGELASRLDYPSLEDDVREMLRTLMPCEREVRSRDGAWYSARILPYRTQDEVIDGAVLTFVDISATRGGAGAGVGHAADTRATDAPPAHVDDLQNRS
jgi:two-component system CheB/CheR fusion protein